MEGNSSYLALSGLSDVADLPLLLFPVLGVCKFSSFPFRMCFVCSAPCSHQPHLSSAQRRFVICSHFPLWCFCCCSDQKPLGGVRVYLTHRIKSFIGEAMGGTGGRN